MSRSLYEMMGNVRVRLDNPRAEHPGDFALLQQVSTHTRTVLRHKQNSGNPWNFGDCVINVIGQQQLYEINVPEFGTPLAVRTSDPNNPNHIVRLIDFYLPQNLYYEWGLPQNWGAWWISPDGSQNTAARCDFTWRNGKPFIEFLPIPY